MSKTQDIGNKGEQIAETYLVQKGYIILERNWRFSRAELDIIAIFNDLLVFVEVKTRAYTYFGQPAEFVDKKKQRLMIDAASEYIEKSGHTNEFRFDIIGIVLNQDHLVSIEHFEDAFWPGWETE